MNVNQKMMQEIKALAKLQQEGEVNKETRKIFLKMILYSFSFALWYRISSRILLLWNTSNSSRLALLTSLIVKWAHYSFHNIRITLRPLSSVRNIIEDIRYQIYFGSHWAPRKMFLMFLRKSCHRESSRLSPNGLLDFKRACYKQLFKFWCSACELSAIDALFGYLNPYHLSGW